MNPYILTNSKKDEEKQILINPLKSGRSSEEFKAPLHIPVMYKEVLSYLSPKPGMVILDATVGVGGHSRVILEKLKGKGKLIGIDQDESSLEVAAQLLRKYYKSVTLARKLDEINNAKLSNGVKLIKANFQDIDVVLESLSIDKINGVLFDLGVSSFQLSCAERGFSIKQNGPLDMRMDTSKKITAFDLVNYLSYNELYTILKKFGEERFAKRIVQGIVKHRKKSPIFTTSQLVQIIEDNVPLKYKKSRIIHPATRTFQAIRIAVNRELQVLEEGLYKIVGFLEKHARICVISFHSLEDRIVKNTFKEFQKKEKIRIITKKPLVPSQEEIIKNPSSRSAKMRVAEKL